MTWINSSSNLPDGSVIHPGLEVSNSVTALSGNKMTELLYTNISYASQNCFKEANTMSGFLFTFYESQRNLSHCFNFGISYLILFTVNLLFSYYLNIIIPKRLTLIDKVK